MTYCRIVTGKCLDRMYVFKGPEVKYWTQRDLLGDEGVDTSALMLWEYGF